MARRAGTLPIGQVMTAKIRLLRHTTPGRLLAEIGAELGSPLLEFGQLGPQAVETMLRQPHSLPLSLTDLLVAIPMNWSEQISGVAS